VPEHAEPDWKAVQAELRREVSDFTFHLWLEPLRLAHRAEATLFVTAPAHVRTWVRDRHMHQLGSAARAVLGEAGRIELVDEAWVPADTAGATAGPGSGARETPASFNPKYAFDQFVIGDGNRLAHAAALAVAEQPGQAYNPLFLHGPPGLGKTHLLHAIGNYVQAHDPGLAVHYATVETFTNEFVKAVRGGNPAEFKERFRRSDVVLIDDVQFLAEKTKTKEEFFHSFNALYEAGSQLVFTSDRSPSDLESFEARLRERFGCGLVAEVEPPDFDVRMAILRKRAGLDALADVSEETLLEIARRVTASVRVLEGALIRVVAYASLRGERASPALASHVLGRLYPAASHKSSLEEIQDACAAAYGLERTALLAQDRTRHVALARQVAMYLSRELTDETLPEIGRRFGGRNHTTVLHAHRKVALGMTADRDTADKVRDIRRRLGNAG